MGRQAAKRDFAILHPINNLSTPIVSRFEMIAINPDVMFVSFQIIGNTFNDGRVEVMTITEKNLHGG